jgi:hypothetical protein
VDFSKKFELSDDDFGSDLKTETEQEVCNHSSVVYSLYVFWKGYMIEKG